PLSVRVSGIYTIATDTGGFVGALFEGQQARELFTDGAHVAFVDIAGTGVDQEALREEVAAAFPALKVVTGDTVREEFKSGLFEALNFVNYFLLAFGAISLLV